MGYSYVQDKYGNLAGSSELLDYQKDRIGMVTLEEDPYENIAAFHYMTPVNMGVVYDFGTDRKNYGMSPEEWFDDILTKDMSHIYVLNLDDSFIDTYGECFMNTPHKGMYYIDKENRMLIACE